MAVEAILETLRHSEHTENRLLGEARGSVIRGQAGVLGDSYLRRRHDAMGGSAGGRLVSDGRYAS
jgi:hypothetical protein